MFKVVFMYCVCVLCVLLAFVVCLSTPNYGRKKIEQYEHEYLKDWPVDRRMRTVHIQHVRYRIHSYPCPCPMQYNVRCALLDSFVRFL